MSAVHKSRRRRRARVMGLNQVGVNDSSTHQTAQVMITRNERRRKKKEKGQPPAGSARGSRWMAETGDLSDAKRSRRNIISSQATHTHIHTRKRPSSLPLSGPLNPGHSIKLRRLRTLAVTLRQLDTHTHTHKYTKHRSWSNSERAPVRRERRT